MLLKRIIALTKPFRYWLDALTFPREAAQAELSQWKDRYRGRPMLVIGNGPSLNDTPLERFCGVPAIGMNKIDLIFKRTAWRPSAIVCVNNVVAGQNWQQFAESPIPVYLSWKCRHHIPGRHRKRMKYFLNSLSNGFSTDFAAQVGSSVTVTYAALQLAYYTGANPVILFGVDHSFKVDGQPREYKRREGRDENHFDPNYFASGQLWGLPDLDQSEVEYLMARAAFEADGRKIYDATVGGKLEIFEKISVEEAVRLCET